MRSLLVYFCEQVHKKSAEKIAKMTNVSTIINNVFFIIHAQRISRLYVGHVFQT